MDWWKTQPQAQVAAAVQGTAAVVWVVTGQTAAASEASEVWAVSAVWAEGEAVWAATGVLGKRTPVWMPRRWHRCHPCSSPSERYSTPPSCMHPCTR